MIYREFQDEQLSMLGFGIMRLPLAEDGSVDEVRTQEMVDYAIDHGVNYFDTAWPYHDGESERIIGRALKKYDRSQFYLADKFPAFDPDAAYDPAATFEAQLQKCGVDYFDFYLLHNVNESSIATFTDPRWGIIDYLKEQKRLGRIRHLGFSCHSAVDHMEHFLDLYGADMEFCQIQLNYLDWTLQDARGKVHLLNERGIPIWVMEPVRGGKLANLREHEEARLHAARPEASTASWGFRFVQGVPGIHVVLSGMSNMEQMQDNIRTFSEPNALSAEEVDLLLDLAEGMKDSVPCTACRYCCKGCPMGLDIPTLLADYNEMRYAANMLPTMRVGLLPPAKRPYACIACGKCSWICPQQIDIPTALRDLAERCAAHPDWEKYSRRGENKR